MSHRHVGVVAIALVLAGCGASAAQPDRNALKHEVTPKELLRKAEASARVGDMTRAEQYLVAAQRAGADERVVVKRLLVVCVADQRYPVALEYAEQYLRRHPRDSDVKFAVASLLAALGERERARDLMFELVREHPEWADVHYALASVLRQQGDQLELADEHDLQYLRLSPQGTFAEAARDRLRRPVP